MPASGLSSWRNTLKSAMDPTKARVMIGKVIKRFTDTQGTIDAAQNKQWLAANARSLDDWLVKLDLSLQAEMKEFMVRLDGHAKQVLTAIPYDLGGGGGTMRSRRPLVWRMVSTPRPESTSVIVSDSASEMRSPEP